MTIDIKKNILDSIVESLKELISIYWIGLIIIFLSIIINKGSIDGLNSNDSSYLYVYNLLFGFVVSGFSSLQRRLSLKKLETFVNINTGIILLYSVLVILTTLVLTVEVFSSYRIYMVWLAIGGAFVHFLFELIFALYNKNWKIKSEKSASKRRTELDSKIEDDGNAAFKTTNQS